MKLDKNLKHHIRKNRYYYSQLIKYLRFYIPSGSSVLDVGCGNGTLLSALKPKRGLGIDSNRAAIADAKKRHPKLDFLNNKAEKFASTETFDYILLCNSIGSVHDIQTVLEHLKKNCHRETRIIIFHYSFLWWPLLKLAEKLKLKRPDGIQNWVGAQDVSNFLALSGYDIISQSTKIIAPLWIPVLSNLANKYLANLPLLNKLNLMHVTIARVPRPLTGDETSASIIIPARNEMGNIESAITRTPTLGTSTEFIFIEGGSSDDTWKEIQRVAEKYKQTHTIKFAKQTGRGKGDAVRKGYSLATNNVLYILDADLTMPPEELPKFHEQICSGRGEFINGSRLVYPMEQKAMRPLNLIGNKTFSLIFTFLLRQRFKDTLCGTKVLTRTNYNKIAQGRSYFGDFDPFGDFDLLFGAAKQNLKIIEVPIHYKERTYGDTNISRWKHGMILLRMCIFASRKIKFI
ncbi:glycosyltransferase [Candidatus Woesearchaeota archaeon]|nr:MAG: glycosyltransferase [Candidatus Woesearchaeota archaeon]